MATETETSPESETAKRLRRESLIAELAEGPGMEMLLLSQAGIPLVPRQADLTPLQKDVLMEAMRIQAQRQADAVWRGGRGRQVSG